MTSLLTSPKPPSHARAIPRTALLAAAAALVCSMAVFALSIHDHPLYDPDEGRYARCSQETLDAGNLLVPIWQGEPRLQKPPVIHWLQGACYVMLGDSEMAARLPSVLFTLLTAVLVMQVCRRLFDTTTAIIAGTLFISAPLVMVVGRLCIIDPVLNFWWTAGLLTGYMALGASSERDQRPRADAAYLFACFVSLGIGMLVKGPIALIALGVLVVWAGLCGRWRAVRGWQALAGLLIIVAPLLTWAALVILDRPDAWELWQRETLERMRGTGDHREAVWYYLPVVAAAFFPITALLPLPGVHYRLSDMWKPLRGGSFGAFLALAVLVPLAVLSLMGGKLATYVLPLGAPLAMGAAMGLRRWLDVAEDQKVIAAEKSHPARRLPNGLGSIAVIYTLGTLIGLALMHTPRVTAKIGLHERSVGVAQGYFLALAALIPLVWLAYGLWRRAAWRAWALVTLSFTLWAVWLITLELGEDRMTVPGSGARLVQRIAECLPGERPHLMLFGMRQNALSFYAHQHVPRIDGIPRPAIEVPEGATPVVVLEAHELEAFARQEPAMSRRSEELLRWPQARGEWVVLRLAR